MPTRPYQERIGPCLPGKTSRFIPRIVIGELFTEGELCTTLPFSLLQLCKACTHCKVTTHLRPMRPGL